MRVIIQGRHLDITDGIRSYTETKMNKLKKFSENIIEVYVTLGAAKLKSGNCHTADVLMKVNGNLFKAIATEPDLYAAIDKVTDILERHVVKHKDKIVDTRNHNADEKKVRFNPETGMIETREERKIIDVTLQPRPMSVEEAILQLEALDKDFFVFMNSETETMNVVYKRRDGHYGHIEPAE